jgi:hypothetical protein
LKSDDASLIFRLIGGGTAPNVPPLPTGVVSPPPTGADPLISIPRDLVARPGAIVSVPIMLTATDPQPITLSAADLNLAYDHRKLQLLGIRSGSLLDSHSTRIGPIPLEEMGQLELHAWSNQRTVPLAPGATGTLIVIDFFVSPDATGELAINLFPGSRTRTAVYDEHFTELILTKVPSTADNDSIDGLITLLAEDLNSPSNFLASRRGLPIGPHPLRN